MNMNTVLLVMWLLVLTLSYKGGVLVLHKAELLHNEQD
jgi:hypothetical protein